MPNGSGGRSSLPVAGLAGVVLAAVAVLVSNQAPYLGTRPPESAKFPDLSIALQHVDARLWQDPFSAVEDFEHRELARRTFDSDAQKLTASQAAREALGAHSNAPPFFFTRFGVTLKQFQGLLKGSGAASPPGSETRALPVLMSGSHFVGAEEARRRTRYAVLAALDELGYAPVDGEHIGYVVVPSSHPASEAPPVRVPFEAYRHTNPPNALPAQIIILWVDESALAPPTWLESLADVLRTLQVCPPAPQQCDVPVIGPSSSDRYDALVRELDQPGAASLRWLVSPFVTSNLLDDTSIRAMLATHRLEVLPTIVSDRVVIDALLGELTWRKVPLCEPSSKPYKYIVLVGEWDTAYGRRAKETFTKEFAARPCSSGNTRRAVILSYSFVRGLDGVALGTSDSPPRNTNANSVAPLGNGNGGAQIEWPESSDQRDYLRRIGQRLTQLNASRSVVAVGILASDTHDKILLLQGLRGIFPRAVFFTTDVDARYMHPLVQPWTRNLIIGGAYGLALGEDLQQQTPPFRDGYQTSTFLATSAALQLPAGGAARRTDWTFLGKQPVQLYEVGRTRLVPLLADSGKSTERPSCKLAVLDECPTKELQPRYQIIGRGLRMRLGLTVVWLAFAVSMFGWVWWNPGRGVTRWTGAGPVMSYVFSIGLAGSLIYLAWLLRQVAYPDTRASPPEPLWFTEGVSSWPIALLWCFGLALTFMFLARIARTVGPRLEATREQFLGGSGGTESESKARSGYWDWLKTTLCAPRATTARPFSDVWARHAPQAHGWRRVARIAVLWTIVFLFPFLLVHGTDLAPPPVIRGPFHSVLWGLGIGDLVMLTVLMAAVADAAIFCTLFVVDLGRQSTVYASSVLEATCRRLGLCDELKPYLNRYIDCELVGERTASVAEYLYYPFVVLAVLAVSMTSLFDDWVFSLARVGLYAIYVGVLLLLWLCLHSAATRARAAALEEMRNTWIGLQGEQNYDQVTADAMRRQFPLLIEHVQSLSIGAYGPLLGQPIFRALLWPLGTLSSTQLVQYLFLR